MEDKKLIFTTDKKVIFCDCSHGVIAFEYDQELDSVFASLYELYGNHSDSWTQRLKHCWNILVTGRPWTDCVVINREKAEQILEFLKLNLTRKTE